jgi:hypothetical protein
LIIVAAAAALGSALVSIPAASADPPTQQPYLGNPIELVCPKGQNVLACALGLLLN